MRGGNPVARRGGEHQSGKICSKGRIGPADLGADMGPKVKILGALDLVVIVILEIIILDELVAHPRVDQFALARHDADAGKNGRDRELPIVKGGAESPARDPAVLKSSRPAAIGPGQAIVFLKLIDYIAAVVQRIDTQVIGAAGAARPAGIKRIKKSVSYTHLRAHETRHDLVCRL